MCLYNSINLLKDLSNQRLITQGAALHGCLIKMGMSSERYIAVKLLNMYLNCRKSFEINHMLKEFNGFDLVVHNCLINANVEWGELDEARRLFDEMPERNEVTWTALVSGLLKYGKVKDAMWYFERNPFQNVFFWTATICGLVQNGLAFQGMKLFLRMLKFRIMPNAVTFTTLIRACGDLCDFELGMSILSLIVKVGFEDELAVSNSLISFNLRLGEIELARQIFDRMEEKDVVSWTAILDMYVEMDNLEEARRIFDDMPERNEVSWSAMIARYSQSGYPEEAVLLFLQMVRSGVKPSTSCFSSAISACASLLALQSGRNIHGQVIKNGIQEDLFVSSSLVDLYCKCGNTEDGRRVFEYSAMQKNVVCWNSMIAGYGLNGQLEEAKELFDQMRNKNSISWNSLIAAYLKIEQFDKVLDVFNEMLLSGETPTKSTFSSVLCACASLASLEKGRNLHGRIVKLGFEFDVYVATALTDMYCKSGNIESSRQLFNRIDRRNEICWTAMIQGLAENGFAEESLTLFEEMLQSSVAPNELILLAVLFACSHCGLIDKGLYYFNLMEKVYNIKPIDKHYTCVVDMLSRSGRLSEAEKFITSMPCEPEANAWAALLSGCKTYKDEKLAEKAARKLSELEDKSGGFVLLSNVYASAGRWLDVLNTRKLMKEKGLKKIGGCSWIEVGNHVHVFFSQDGSHTHSVEIFGILELLKSEMVIS